MKYLGTKELKTDRLILRKINKDDYEMAFNNWCNSDEVTKYVLWNKHNNEKETKELYDLWINDYDEKTFRWIIEEKNSNEVIGTIDISKKLINYGTCEIGYCLGEKYWNQGYMTEALNAVLEYLFIKCDANTVWGQFLVNNLASGRVMQKVGMTYEGTLRNRVIDKEGKLNNLNVYSIIKEEYLNTKDNK